MKRDLDEVQYERVKNNLKKWNDGNALEIDELISSESIINALDEQKAIVFSFDLPKILALLPFSKYVCVEMCGTCVRANDFDAFKALIQTGLIIPILSNSYSEYPDAVLKLVIGYPHLSVQEYSFYRYVVLGTEAGGNLCGHCVDEKVKDIKKLVSRRKGAPEFRRKMDQVNECLFPHISPDFELLDEISSAFRTLDAERMDQLADLSYAIRSVRSAQVMNAALSVEASDFSRLPTGTFDDNDQARSLALSLREVVVSGLGLKIPTDINIHQYVEILTDYRPSILKITDSVIENSESDGVVSVESLNESVYGINSEIQKIRGLKRYMLYEASVEFVGKNPTFVASALVAGAMGLAGSFIGCIGTATAGTAANMAKNKWKLKTGKSFSRLGSKIHADLQPSIDELVAKYVGSNIPTMRVMSLQKSLDRKKYTS